MKNAFSILGATPNDNVDKLRELFEEKQLFFDDDTEINYAYTELINLKKRIKHEIRYFSRKTFKNFDNIFFENDEEEQEVVIDDMCQAIIDVGKWFDLSSEVILDEINNSRNKSGFTPIGDAEILQETINDFRAECILGVKQYFDFFKGKDIVTWFNTLVKQDDYMSFFIDDLLVLYEDVMSESIKKKEKDCNKKFGLIEQDVNLFLSDGILLFDGLSNKIVNFEKSLSAWDKIVQPLQVNFENRGGRHGTSVDFATMLRNKVIDMCNKSQNSLIKQLNPNFYLTHNFYSGSLQYDMVFNITESTRLIQLLKNILNIMGKYFAEIDDFVERLKQDETDLENIKLELQNTLNVIDPYRVHRNKLTKITANCDCKEGNFQNHKETTVADSAWERIVRWILGITILVALIVMVVNFANENGGVGVISLIMVTVTSMLAYGWRRLDIELEFVKLASIALAILMGIVVFASYM